MTNELLKELKEKNNDFIYEFTLPSNGKFEVPEYPKTFRMRIPKVKDEKAYLIKLSQIEDFNEAFAFIISRVTDIKNPEILLPIDRDFILLQIKKSYDGEKIKTIIQDDKGHYNEITVDLSKIEIPKIKKKIPLEYEVELPVSGIKVKMKTMVLKDYISAGRFFNNLQEKDVLTRAYITLAESILSFTTSEGKVYEIDNLYDKYLIIQELQGVDKRALIEGKEPFLPLIKIPVEYTCRVCGTHYNVELGVADVAPF